MSPVWELQRGTYLIYNRVQNAQGQRLAITFNGDQKPVTVTPVGLRNTKQRWIIERFGPDHFGGSGYRVVPEENPGLEVGWGKAIFTQPMGSSNWSIYNEESGAIIKDCERRVSWSINSATDGAEVIPINDATGEKQRWVFHRVIEDALP
ncbi:unnamed protein product [Rhizoctonia solani]|uniref:CCL2-like lectin domain-containing protein n=1 Tax=Rhizoctonia solani TaxID=456999 RepID=A0A8H3AR38_9AGAM|nr:unnamed protein product [Rhizoctonia solani]